MYYLAALDEQEPIPHTEGFDILPAGMRSIGQKWSQVPLNDRWCVMWAQARLRNLSDRRVLLGDAEDRLGAGHRAELRRLAGIDVEDGTTVADLLDGLLTPLQRKRRPIRLGEPRKPIPTLEEKTK